MFLHMLLAEISKTRGGEHYLRTLEPKIREMSAQEQEALFRLLRATHEDGMSDGKREARRSGFPF